MSQTGPSLSDEMGEIAARYQGQEAQVPQGYVDPDLAEPGEAPTQAPPARAAEPPAAPPQPPTSQDILDREPDSIGDDLPYRDAKALRDDLARAREQYRPLRDALGDLDDAGRQEVLRAAQGLGADFADGTSALAGMWPEDRAAIVQAAQMLSSRDPHERAEVADWLRRAADSIGGGQGPAPQAPPPQADDYGDDGSDLLTEDRLRQVLDARDAERAQAEADQRAQQAILDEITGLGYVLDSDDLRERGRTGRLLAIAEGLPDGSIQSAHERLQEYEAAERQAWIDDFVQGKTADAARSLPPDTGAAPSEQRVNETMDDADAAMRARLDATFGPRT